MRARPKTADTRCPECGRPVYRTSSHRGKIRYMHRFSQFPELKGTPRSTRRGPTAVACNWNGTDAIGAEVDQRSGVDRDVSRALKSKVIANRGKKVTYVVTSAQNATPVHENALRSLLTYCRVNGATLLVIPLRYTNPTSIWSKRAEGSDWWAPEVLPYLIDERVVMHKHLVLLADIMTQPTATNPLEGFETITGPQSGILGHPKLELTTVPTPQQRLPKILTTTGSVTKKNYIPSKAGKKGAFHHTFGAAVVELDGKRFHLRQINMLKDGSFCDLLAEYDGDEVRKYDRVPAVVMGDTHVEVIDPEVESGTFTAPDSIVKVLRPEQLVWHDVLDSTASNHHERGRAFHEYVKHHAKRRNVEAEVNRTLEFIDRVTPADTRNIFVPSNHNDFLREWVENTDPRRDPENGNFWCRVFLDIIDSPNTKWTPSGVTVEDAFAHLAKKRLKSTGRATFLRRDQPYQIRDIEVAYHGDKGSGGAPGSISGFAKIGVRSIIGHTHAPGIKAGAYQVGTSSRLDLTYATGGPSGWLNSHCVIYPNGKRSLINVIDGNWRRA